MSWKALGRRRRLINWVSHHQQQKEAAFWLFYGAFPRSSELLESLFLRYGAVGFRWSLYGSLWPKIFWPMHPCYSFLGSGAVYGLYWPSKELWAEAVELFPALRSPDFVLYQGFFLLELPFGDAPAFAAGPSKICGCLASVLLALVDTFHALSCSLVNSLGNISSPLLSYEK
jgi:hypothetical protein